MAKGEMTSKIGSWSFIAGLILAVLAAFVSQSNPAWMIVLLGVLGIIVGFLNITGKETTHFLVASIVLIMSSSSLKVLLGDIPGGGYIDAILRNVALFVVPAAVLVAIKAIYALASEE